MPPQTSGPPSGRVPIPRIKVEAKTRRHRAARACEACRQRKVKCDGIQPTCLQCRELNITCVYSEVKRVRDQKRLEHFMRKADRLERTLRRLSAETEDETLLRRIRKALKVNIETWKDIGLSAYTSACVGSRYTGSGTSCSCRAGGRLQRR